MCAGPDKAKEGKELHWPKINSYHAAVCIIFKQKKCRSESEKKTEIVGDQRRKWKAGRALACQWHLTHAGEKLQSLQLYLPF